MDAGADRGSRCLALYVPDPRSDGASLDKFHLVSQFELMTQLATWVWIAVYIIVPIAMFVLLIQQSRMPGQDRPRVQRLPIWSRGILGIHALILLPLGVLLFLAPASTLPVWTWMLTPLTAHAVGAWLLGLGIAAAHATWENDWNRLNPLRLSILPWASLKS